MREYYRRNLPLYRRETIGFALFLGWVFCTLFGCGLATHDAAIDGTLTNYNLERIWMVSGLFEGLGGLGGIVAARLVPDPAALVRRRGFGAAALACAVAGNMLTWLAWTDRFGTVWAFHVPGGALTGIAVALFAMLWSDRLGSYDEAHVEFAIPLSFTVAFALYFVLLLTKRGSIPFLVLLLAMIALSFWLACRRRGEGRPPAPAARPRPRAHRGLLSFGVLACVSWVQVAFFRVVATPEIMGDRIAHFLIPFTCACVLSLVMLALCLRLSRYLNISLAYRWSLPLFMLSYVPIFIDYGNPTLRLAAYAINFLGMFGVQFGCWLGACKYLRRTGSPALTVFGVYALARGSASSSAASQGSTPCSRWTRRGSWCCRRCCSRPWRSPSWSRASTRSGCSTAPAAAARTARRARRAQTVRGPTWMPCSSRRPARSRRPST